MDGAGVAQADNHNAATSQTHAVRVTRHFIDTFDHIGENNSLDRPITYPISEGSGA
jgi:hypothetical protein